MKVMEDPGRRISKLRLFICSVVKKVHHVCRDDAPKGMEDALARRTRKAGLELLFSPSKKFGQERSVDDLRLHAC